MFYKIIYHRAGKIKIEVPFLKKVPMKEINKFSEYFTKKYMHEGISSVFVNPLTSRIIIFYDENIINIIDFLDKVAKDQVFSDIKR